MRNSDLRETKQMKHHLKGNNNNELNSQLEATRLSAYYKMYKIDDKLIRNIKQKFNVQLFDLQ